MNDDELKRIFCDSCLKHGIHDQKTINELTQAGLQQFEMTELGYVRALGEIPFIGEYVKAYKESHQREGIPKKQQLYGKLVDCAKNGNMKAYRKARAAYSKA